MIKISYSNGKTLNLGNYESARVDVSMEIEVDGSGAIENAYTMVKEWVDAKVAEGVKQYEQK
jgi:hypothetical protein